MPATPKAPPPLSRRERQIMDLVYRLGQATAAEIHGGLPDPPTSTAVRGLLRVLVEKGHLRIEKDGRRYLYLPCTPRRAAGTASITHVVKTFFAGSPADAMAALLGSESDSISEAELARLAALVAKARRGR
jgi:predicted transcriptional regulator